MGLGIGHAIAGEGEDDDKLFLPRDLAVTTGGNATSDICERITVDE